MVDDDFLDIKRIMPSRSDYDGIVENPAAIGKAREVGDFRTAENRRPWKPRWRLGLEVIRILRMA
jgi:hypothetical protein